MSVRLNLLPWREQQRLATLKRFRLSLMASLLAALVVVMVIDRLAHLRLQQQAAASAARETQVRGLKAALQSLDEASADLAMVDAQHAKLVGLRAGQQSVAQLLLDIEQAMLPGMRLTAVQLQGEQLSVNGLVVSSAVLAQFMRELQRSPRLYDLELKRVQGLPGGDGFLLIARTMALGS
ncbi:PilN domain-containing protein [Pseudomonas sp. NPDC089554]|uniref:PilN domain-containing protein n=1 Tax=Pseudomonas sp. NPDC089554 TaxID=3390653 RepID=UPI003D0952C3